MGNVVRFTNTKRKLDWKQEEDMRSSKKADKKFRDNRKAQRETKFIVGEDE
jgi:hypothetical protein